MEFAEQEVRLRTGRCSACGHEFTLLAGVALPSLPATEAGAGPAAETAPAEVSLPECAECGSPLALRTRKDGSIEARCEDCDATTIYVPRAAAEEEEREERPRREVPGRAAGPRGRPCRQCGAPLRFSTNEEGLLVGECEACGNRFTLPPREERGGWGGGFRKGGGPRSRPYGDRGRGPSWGGRGRTGERRPRGFRSDSLGPEGEDRRPRRRRRSER